eukprot:TRINITY_DN11053_c0_g1_i1.p1 TRINITY_DN11053_c0_g1~~TRINITY_DN11053_c0_g1_i1.p1  ORF type:complete len:633 (-),score=151.74 TRINITY_DN11053_c0_g1_i1:131-2029(-)
MDQSYTTLNLQDEKSPLMFGESKLNIMPVTFSFHDIYYTLKSGKTLLNGVDGIINPGTVLAIMGPSGAGKTTLLDVLSNRATKGKTTGKIKINGKERKGKRQEQIFKRISGYVMQDDSLLSVLTVRESLNFAAMLKLPELSKIERHNKVNKVIEQLALTHCADSRLGSQFSRGVSGGERRRVAIGVELITSPSILFLDEPTSGLDGTSAYIVMKTIIDLAKTGVSVICTIHQPRANIYSLFDQLLLLTQGSVCYYGPANNAIDYFGELGFDCDPYTNPSDWMLDLVNKQQKDADNSVLTQEVKQAALEIDFGREYSESNLYHKVKTNVEDSYIETEETRIVNKQMENLKKWAAPLWWQMIVLIYRNSIYNIRERAVIFVRLCQALIMSFIVGTIFFRIPHYHKGDDGIQPITSACFFICTYQVLSSFAGLPRLIEERGRFNREIQSNMYSVFAYFTASFISMLPLLILFTLAFATPAYFLVGMQPHIENFAFFLMAVLMLSLVGDALCKAISALVPTFAIANVIGSLTMTFFMIFSGFFIKPSSLIYIYKWCPYISLFKYSFDAIMINEFIGLEFDCGSIPCSIKTGKDALNYLGINYHFSKWYDLLILFCIWLVFRLLQFIFLKFLNKEKR